MDVTEFGQTDVVDTNSRTVLDSFKFNVVGKKPLLFSRIDFCNPRVPTEEAGYDEDGATSVDISEAEQLKPLGVGASLLKRLGLKEEDMLFNHLSKKMITRTHTQMPAFDSVPLDAPEKNERHLVTGTVESVQEWASEEIQPCISRHPSIAPQNTNASPTFNDNCTRSPTLVHDCKKDQFEARANGKIYKQAEADAASNGQGVEVGQVTDVQVLYTNARRTVCTSRSSQDTMDPNSSGYVISDQSLNDVIPSTVTVSSAKDSPINGSASSRQQTAVPIMASLHTNRQPSPLHSNRQPSPDPLKIMFASVFDEATAAWEEEVMHREKLKSQSSPSIEHPVDKMDSPIVPLGDHTITGLASSTPLPPSSRKPLVASHPTSDAQKVSFSDKMNNPSGLVPTLPANTTTVPMTPSSSHATSPFASNVPQLNFPIANLSTAILTHKSNAQQDNAHGEVEDSNFSSVVADEVYQALTQTGRGVNSKIAFTEASPIGNATTAVDLPMKPCLAIDTQLTEPGIHNKSPTRSRSVSNPVSGGVMLGIRPTLITPVVTTPSPVLADLPLHPIEDETYPMAPRLTASSIPTSVFVDVKRLHELHLNAQRPVNAKSRLSVKDMPPPDCQSLKRNEDMVPASRPLKRKLSSSPVVKKEEDADHEAMVALRYAHPFKPSKMKKVEDEDEKSTLKIEPKEEEKPLSEDDHPTIPQGLPLATATDASNELPVESDCDQQMDRAVSPSMSFRYPSEPPYTATAQSITSVSSNSNYPERQTSQSDMSHISRSRLSYSETNDRSLIERLAEGGQNSMYKTSAPLTYPERSSFYTSEGAARGAFPGSDPRSQPVFEHNVNGSRYMRNFRRVSPRRTRSPSAYVDQYSSAVHHRPFDSPAYRRDERRRSPSPRRSSSPIRNYVRQSQSDAQPSRRKAVWLPDNQDTRPISLGRHSLSASGYEGHLNGNDLERQDIYSSYRTPMDYYDTAGGSVSGRSNRSSGVALIDRFEFSRYNQSSASSLPTITPLTPSVMHKHRTKNDRFIQETSSLLTRVDGLTTRSFDGQPLEKAKRKPTLSDSLPPKPYLYPSSTVPGPKDFGSVPSQISASRLSDRLGPPAFSVSSSKNDAYETRNTRKDKSPQAPHPLCADMHPRAAQPQYSKSEEAPSLLRRMGDGIMKTGSPESQVYTEVNISTEEYTRSKPTSKAQSSPKTLKTNATKTWRNLPLPDSQQRVSNLEERLSVNFISGKPEAYEFSGQRQQNEFRGGVQKAKFSSRRGIPNKHYPSSPRPRPNSSHPYRNNAATTLTSPHRQGPSASPGDKLARRIK